MEQMRSQFLRPKQVATEYNIGLSTVWRYSKNGYFTPIKVTGGVTVFARDEIDNFFSGNARNQTLVT